MLFYVFIGTCRKGFCLYFTYKKLGAKDTVTFLKVISQTFIIIVGLLYSLRCLATRHATVFLLEQTDSVVTLGLKLAHDTMVT